MTNSTPTPLVDTLGRPIRDLRISVTDRCNFRCTYCMPRSVFDKNYQFLARTELLSFEELHRIAQVFNRLGVRKIRITGGEPLLRRNVDKLIGVLKSIPDLELTLTTNGVLLPRMAPKLAEAGLDRVTVSLDALDDATFQKIADVDLSVEDVISGIDAARDAGLRPVKVNMVVKRGINDDQIVAMAERFRGSGHILRFIEFMDVGTSNGWRMDDVVPSREVVERIHARFPLETVDPNYTGEVAERWRYVDGAGEIGVISSVTQAFCRDCSRIRLSTEGKLFTCLFASAGFDLRTPLRDGASDDELAGMIAQLWRQRADRYSEIRSENTRPLKRIEMSYIGG
ncbi:GTP 3',8-cyclase MoaA [Nitrogeniibacter mangrovi]|uniref:GTP 3',8-cyclase n=1 Tax=Nitrogeniibacter mangrovi TaxID=2016596 RepID=A0A6C1B281_9RHOO|nr:GTP 3',8-cyclase MoaA [Nitrogeniibacter mangrovi]QID17746.1 GTP 3',8-cyclase MoaA [Nitrogeniibacter mangrovi]